MKKLNITKEQFNRSNYFQRKYGKLKYVSESGRLFKTNKGKVLKFNEAVEPPSPGKTIEKWIRVSIKDGTLPGVEKFKAGYENQIKYKGSFMYWAYVLQQIGLDSGRKDLFADESEEYYPTQKYISKVEDWLMKMPDEKRASLVLDALDKVYEKGGVFTTANTDHTWLGIPGTEDGGEAILYKGHEVTKDDIYEYLAEDYPEFADLQGGEEEAWLKAHKKEVRAMLQDMAWAYDESTRKFGRKFVKEYVDDSAGLYGLPADHYSDATRERMENFAMQQRLKKGVILRRTNKIYDLWRIETVEGGLRLENNINGFDKAMKIAKKNGWKVVQTIPASAGKVNESFVM